MRFHLFTNRPVAAALIVGTLLAVHAQAGSETVAPKHPFFDGQSAASTPAATEYVVLRRPYLQIVRPTGLRFAEADEPLSRRPPRLPAVRTAPISEKKEAEAKPVITPTIISTTANPLLPASSSASVITSTDDSTILPPPAPTATPALAPQSAPLPDTLSQSNQKSADLSDALLYLDAPTAQGTRAVIEAPLSLQAPTGQPQPPSSATYQVQ